MPKALAVGAAIVVVIVIVVVVGVRVSLASVVWGCKIALPRQELGEGGEGIVGEADVVSHL